MLIVVRYYYFISIAMICKCAVVVRSYCLHHCYYCKILLYRYYYSIINCLKYSGIHEISSERNLS